MVTELQKLMCENDIDWFIVFSADEHLSEYTSESDRYLACVTGFTGSAGTLLLGHDEAYMWTDSRYYVQASYQLDKEKVSLMKAGMPHVPTIEGFLSEHVWDGQRIAFDHRSVSYEYYKRLSDKLPKSVELIDGADILKKLLPDMPKREYRSIVPVPECNCQKSAEDKLLSLRKKIRKNYVPEDSYTYIISDLPSIMWLFNLRGSDINYVPVAYSYATITEYTATIYIHRSDLSDEAATELSKTGVIVKEYSLFYRDIQDIATDVVLADPYANNSKILCGYDDSGVLIECSDPILIPKAYKNDAETEGMRRCHITDAVAMIRFIRKVKEMARKGDLPDEYELGKILDDMRIQNGADSLSFKTICAYKENSAIVHYIAHEKTAKKIEPKGFLLVDSGGQYRFDGTTDITRTIALGECSDEEKRVYTTVLKGNLRLMNFIFPEGFKGPLLDTIAEEVLWSSGYFCGHGIGHGVGCYLSVHESEARIGRCEGAREVPFRPGVIVSNEPGVYLEGKFGVRLENLLLTVRGDCIDGHDMCRFEPLTLVPFDADAIDFSMLSEEESGILSDYNRLILEKTGPLLNEEERAWIKEIIDIK